jgi:hypothetical protein
MIVRCGACQSQFDVPGPGRFGCPACGSVNNVSSGRPPTMPTGPARGPGGMPGGMPGGPPPPPPAPARPSPRISCPECEFSFIVGNIATATCPNCGTEVETGRGEPGAPT